MEKVNPYLEKIALFWSSPGNKLGKFYHTRNKQIGDLISKHSLDVVKDKSLKGLGNKEFNAAYVKQMKGHEGLRTEFEGLHKTHTEKLKKLDKNHKAISHKIALNSYLSGYKSLSK